MSFYELEKGTYLVEILCAGGAYQPLYVYQYFDENQKTPQSFPLLSFKQYEREPSGKVTTRLESEISGLPTFDPKNKTLTILSKSRGPGDCGSLVTYQFEHGKPVAIQARARACREQKWVEPEQWPIIKNP
ncbi:MAG: DUF1176 domain-containing protein [Blastocatellia bacterium]|nr:DUF1176 domain-containing protein [Blastocatellia bacterium]